MGPIEACANGFKKIFRFGGRASRSEFWWFYVGSAVIGILLYVAYLVMLGAVIGLTATDVDGNGVLTSDEITSAWTGLTTALFVILVLALSLALMASWVRRLHDTGKPGGWLMLSFIGLGIVPFIMAMFPSEPHINDYGPEVY
ncbi:DUF805 domain-containing protein [Demequina sp. B12]|uniref:DUF805 domain-containing protein n=1 Tax=Demequina sp. B12 TaxID=2992757 RepID=UPI00237A787A|nr:DUF805 domain-containing protein [Demequina sp. B12]MDE0572144.1 DUF805 domain-containing protein [Demequina sp. B12]